MAAYLTTDQVTELTAVAAELGSAPKYPLDATQSERLARVASAVGFATTGAFLERVKDKPLATLVEWILQINGTTNAK